MMVMAGYGIPRSYRHMDGWGVHTYRLVTNEGNTKLVRWNWKSLQGKASFLWEEAQIVGGKNSDFHRQDMWNAIEAGVYPEWEVCFIWLVIFHFVLLTISSSASKS